MVTDVLLMHYHLMVAIFETRRGNFGSTTVRGDCLIEARPVVEKDIPLELAIV